MSLAGIFLQPKHKIIFVRLVKDDNQLELDQIIIVRHLMKGGME